jgi:proline racemase
MKVLSLLPNSCAKNRDINPIIEGWAYISATHKITAVLS